MFKVGDKVRVKKDLEVNEWYGGFMFAEGMKKHTGSTFEIYMIDGSSYRFRDSQYAWSNEMLEPTTLSTAEMIAALAANPQAKYESQDGFTATCDGGSIIRLYYHKNKEYSHFNGNVDVNDCWTLISPEPKPVTKDEAIAAFAKGKTIFCTHESFPSHTYINNGEGLKDEHGDPITARELLEHIWYIKET